MDTMTVPDLVAHLGSEEDSYRKMAVFKLQAALGDPAFADVFISQGGLPKLTDLTLRANGNTLAYALTSFCKLLDLDMGWDYVSEELVERAVQLVVTNPLVNILRSAVSVLVAITSRPHTFGDGRGTSGFRALKPAVTLHPSFLEMLVSILSSVDETQLAANALQLINSLIREAVTNDAEAEWPKFIKKLQDLGVIRAVYRLMQGQALSDLAQPLLEFQSLTKIMLRKWRDVRVDMDKPEHKRALRSISFASYSPSDTYAQGSSRGGGSKRNRDPERWRRIGFQSEMPGAEFEETGFLGMMDLTDFVVKNEDQFRKLILEQTNKASELRCPIARASLAVTYVLYEHFGIHEGDLDDAKAYAVLESRHNIDKAFKPLLLHWSRLHTAGLNAFLRLWKVTGAEVGDFEKVAELVKILVADIVGNASRMKDIADVEHDLSETDYQKLRRRQMELIEETYEHAWGHHLKFVNDDLKDEAAQFVKEQRIRCLLDGAWFPTSFSYSDSGPVTKHNVNRATASSWRFVRLSHNRRWLHYADFDAQKEPSPGLDQLTEKLDLSRVSSVVSNISASPPPSPSISAASDKTLSNTKISKDGSGNTTASAKITVYGFAAPPTPANPMSPSAPRRPSASAENKETVLLQLHPGSKTLASEWVDGLLMLLNQRPITAETERLEEMIANYGLRIRLLNIRYEDLDAQEPRNPGREGLDDDYWFDFGGL
ncbi:hypothetical protein BT63DRAFT_366695 [Microthyrium microscopicum]|uniref:ELMO domain-containing protein n=1 Tax=Microthyrium microscopicum TaxID=703497 RepID=A0A6A6UU34_9PEZI|nr:hypothetical protein BT63DRAFT_366695 [Microthyrium microscopicum]